MNEIIRIKVEQRHYDKAFRKSMEANPVSLAMLEAGLEVPMADSRRMYWGRLLDDGGRREFEVDLPEDVADFLHTFHHKGRRFIEFEPFEFELEATAEDKRSGRD